MSPGEEPGIVDEPEVVRWIEEGKSEQWMTEEYERRYNLVVPRTAFAALRARRGPVAGDSHRAALIPWEIREEHRWEYPLAMLRLEARRREGRPLRPIDVQRLTSWKVQLEDKGAVVHYDPDTDEGWSYVPRRPGVDADLIRVPDPEPPEDERRG